jgi:hypothetical protein
MFRIIEGCGESHRWRIRTCKHEESAFGVVFGPLRATYAVDDHVHHRHGTRSYRVSAGGDRCSHASRDSRLSHDDAREGFYRLFERIFFPRLASSVQFYYFFAAHYIRELLKAEKWELALEISTKFGFSKIGVLAAWGKACLKSGCFDLARHKFALCFKANAPLNVSHQSSGHDDSAEIVVKKNDSPSHQNKNYPALLDDIVSILESNSYCLNSHILKKAESIKVFFGILDGLLVFNFDFNGFRINTRNLIRRNTNLNRNIQKCPSV